MKRLAQVPLGSNPATAKSVGADNVLLNNTAQTESTAVTPEKLHKVLQNVERYGNDPKHHDELVQAVEDLTANSKNPNIKKKLNIIGEALQNTKDSDKATTDPETGKKDPKAKDLASNLDNQIKPLIQEANKVYNNRLAQKAIEKKKKKTRGNPFRVLMGKVGKLLDHGVEKRDIVRYLAKLKYWNNETIERAVDIVRDYNKKKKRDSDKEDNEKKAKSENNLRTSALDYDRAPDFKKRSTGELIARVCFLTDLLESDKFTKQGDFKNPSDKKGAKEELKLLKEALIDRGVDKEDISNLGLGN